MARLCVTPELTAPSPSSRMRVVGGHRRNKPDAAFTEPSAESPPGFTESLLQVKASRRTLGQGEALWFFKVYFGIFWLFSFSEIPLCCLSFAAPCMTLRALSVSSATGWCCTDQERVLD